MTLYRYMACLEVIFHHGVHIGTIIDLTRTWVARILRVSQLDTWRVGGRPGVERKDAHIRKFREIESY